MGLLRESSSAMDAAPLASNRFRKLAEDSTVVLKVTAPDGKNIHAQTSEISQAWPKRQGPAGRRSLNPGAPPSGPNHCLRYSSRAHDYRTAIPPQDGASRGCGPSRHQEAQPLPWLNSTGNREHQQPHAAARRVAPSRISVIGALSEGTRALDASRTTKRRSSTICERRRLLSERRRGDIDGGGAAEVIGDLGRSTRRLSQRNDAS